jgi:hypothetical protein
MGAITTYVNSSAAYKAQIRIIIEDTIGFLKASNKLAWLEAKGVVIDEKLKRELDIYYFIDIICPMTTEESFSVLAMRVIENMSIASITAADKPIPITGSGSIETAISNLFKIAIGLSYNEAQQIQFAELMQRQQIPEAVLMRVYKNIEDLPKKVVRTMIALAYQLFTTGRVFYKDPRTNVTAQMDFNTIPALFPPALTGNDAWDKPATARGIDNMQDHVNSYYDWNSAIPVYVVAHYRTWQNFCRQQQVKDEAIAIGLINANPTGNVQITWERLKTIFKEKHFPEPIAVNAQYEIELRPGVRERVNCVPEGKYFFANPDMGERIFGQTIESKKGSADGSYTAGIHVDLDPKTESETEDKIVAIGRGIPHVDNPKELAGRTVYVN